MEAVTRQVNRGPMMRIADIIALTVLLLSVLIAAAFYTYYQYLYKPENVVVAVNNGAYIDAARMLKDSADSGNVSAEISLANLYRFGLGVPQSFPAAVSMYWHSARQGHVSAMVNLALMYRQGLGVEKDAEVAYAWLNLARDKRSRVAQYYMSEMLANHELSAQRVPEVKTTFSTVESMPEPVTVPAR